MSTHCATPRVPHGKCRQGPHRVEQGAKLEEGKWEGGGDREGVSALGRRARPRHRVSHGARACHSPHLPPASETQARPALPGRRQLRPETPFLPLLWMSDLG